MTKKLTGRQKRIIEIIRQSLEDFGYAPTIREMMSKLRLKSPRAVSYHINELEKLGYLRRTGDDSRNIQVVDIDPQSPYHEFIKVPLVGWSAGGSAILAEQNILDWIPISTRFFKTGHDVFLLKVKGDSMSPKIEDCDTIIVKKQYTADPGQTIVALIGDETTVKKYVPREDHIILQPENSNYEPIVIFPDELRIQGVVQGVLRQY